MNFNLRQLEAFVQVARLGGFSRAAAHLHLSQAGLSILIRKLEEKLDTRVFERTTRAVVLTDAGRHILPVAERVLADIQSLVSTGREVGAHFSGHLTLALPPRLAVTMLPRILREFSARYPKVSVVFRECINEETLSRIYARDVEFGLAFGIEPTTELDCQPLGEDALVVVCRRDHALAKKRSVKWRDLVGHRIITLPVTSTSRTLIERQFALLGETLVPVYEANTVPAIALAREGLGIAVVSSHITPPDQDQELVQHVIRDPVITRPLVVVTRRTSTLSEAAKAFIELVALSMAAPALKSALPP